jgi:hypothetical protein
MLVRLLRTIYYVVSNPNRSVAWKVIDSLFLAFLVVLVVISLTEPFDYLLLLPWVVLVTCRSWYSLPKAPKRARCRLQEHGIPSEPVSGGAIGGRAEGSKRAWDAMGDEQTADRPSSI